MSDRGIKKFAPFKSLKGQYEMIDKMKYEKNKIPKPTLEVDQIEKIQESLTYLQQDLDKVVEITYFKDGYIKDIKGEIEKMSDSYLILGNIRISFIDILDIEII